LAWILFAVLLAAFPLRAQESQPSEEVTPPEQKSSVLSKNINDLKGDKLGETLAVFTANHPKTRCLKRDSSLSDCHVWDDVSIAGVSLRGVENCKSEAEASNISPRINCLQGIDAHFVSELLAGLSYTMEGDESSKNLIATAFKQEYGPPTTDDKNETMWSNDLLTLSVTLLKPNPKTSYVVVTLDPKISEIGEDI
jgi:hypothetical protein